MLLSQPILAPETSELGVALAFSMSTPSSPSSHPTASVLGAQRLGDGQTSRQRKLEAPSSTILVPASPTSLLLDSPERPPARLTAPPTPPYRTTTSGEFAEHSTLSLRVEDEEEKIGETASGREMKRRKIELGDEKRGARVLVAASPEGDDGDRNEGEVKTSEAGTGLDRRRGASLGQDGMVEMASEEEALQEVQHVADYEQDEEWHETWHYWEPEPELDHDVELAEAEDDHESGEGVVGEKETLSGKMAEGGLEEAEDRMSWVDEASGEEEDELAQWHAEELQEEAERRQRQAEQVAADLAYAQALAAAFEAEIDLHPSMRRTRPATRTPSPAPTRTRINDLGATPGPSRPRSTANRARRRILCSSEEELESEQERDGSEEDDIIEVDHLGRRKWQ